MVIQIPKLDGRIAIADKQGRPTLPFLKAWTQLLSAKVGTVANSIIAGVGLSGGGSLNSGNVTLSADEQAILNQISTTRGALLYRGASAWSALSPGASGLVLTSNGSGADPSYKSSGGIDFFGAREYWRINITASTGPNAAIAELEFRASIGGATQTSGGTASASTEFGASFAASKAFDGDSATYWAASAGTGWLRYQFATPVSVAQISVQARPDFSASGAPTDFTIEYSDDGTTWTVARTITGEPGWTVGETRTYSVFDTDAVPEGPTNLYHTDARSVTAISDAVAGDGLVARTAAGTFAARSVAAGAGGSVSISNGSGVAGNPTISRAALTGDVTAPADSNETTIANGAVTSAKLASGIIREKLAADRTYFVSTAGSDSNDGLSAGAPFLTIQHAIDVCTTLDFNGHNITIQLADGTYSEAVSVNSMVGQPSPSALNIQGNVTTPTNVIVDTPTANCFNALPGSAFRISSLNVRASAGGGSNGLISISGGFAAIEVEGVDFGAHTNGYHMFAGASGAQISIVDSYTISGGAQSHISCGRNASIVYSGSPTVTLTGTPDFSNAFCRVQQLGFVYCPGTIVTFSGAATGSRYNITQNSVVVTSLSGATFFPGSVAGTTSTGGIYF